MNRSTSRSSDWSVLVLSRHHPQAASSRLRTFQYVPFLEAAGAEVTLAPFFDEAYLRTLYQTKGRHFSDVLGAYARRIRSLWSARRFSVVWVEKEVFPYLPGWMETVLARTGVPYVVDYDDATFHTYDQHRLGPVRAVLGEKLRPLLHSASAVTLGNSYLEDYVRQRTDCEIVRIPTAVDMARYTGAPDAPDDELRIGWIGTPATTKYLEMLREPLLRVSRVRSIRLITIGASSLEGFDVPLEQHPWSADTEARILSSLHVGVMPLPDEPWERGKCGYKLIQYMAAGRPVVASPVGVNRDIVTPDVGFLAIDSNAWTESLKRLGGERELRWRMGQAGRKLVEQRFSTRVVAPKICETLIKSASKDRP